MIFYKPQTQFDVYVMNTAIFDVNPENINIFRTYFLKIHKQITVAEHCLIHSFCV